MTASIHSIANVRKIPVRSHSREIRRSEAFKAVHVNLEAYVRAKKDEAHIETCMLELADICESNAMLDEAQCVFAMGFTFGEPA